MNKNVFSKTLMILICFISMSAYSNDMNKGLEISKEQVRRDSGWVDAASNIRMFLVDAEGNKHGRELSMQLIEVENDGDKSLVLFNTPLDVKGTAFLTYSHIEGSDDQWIFLPALNRVKRISSKNKSGPFMGSEFSYEDMASFEYQDFTFTYLREEELDGVPCYVVEQKPLDEYSGYQKRVAWINKNEYRVERIDYFDRKGDSLKTLRNLEFKQYLGKFWRASVSEMENHQTGKSTILQWNDYQFRVGLKDSDFSKNSLKRSR